MLVDEKFMSVCLGLKYRDPSTLIEVPEESEIARGVEADGGAALIRGKRLEAQPASPDRQ